MLQVARTKMSASALVVDYIKERLLNGEWGVGAKIATEPELMAAVGVGRQAVREAIGNLVSLDLLDRRQGSGTYVKGLSVNSALNQLLPGVYLNAYDTLAILGFRKIIEPACVRLFIEHYDQKQVDAIAGHLESMKRHEFDRSTNLFSIADGNFHDTIIRGAQNPVIMKIMEIFSSSLFAYQWESFRTIGPKSGVDEHERILNAITNRDAELASLLMLRHIERSESDTLRYRDNHTGRS